MNLSVLYSAMHQFSARAPLSPGLQSLSGRAEKVLGPFPMGGLEWPGRSVQMIKRPQYVRVRPSSTCCAVLVLRSGGPDCAHRATVPRAAHLETWAQPAWAQPARSTASQPGAVQIPIYWILAFSEQLTTLHTYTAITDQPASQDLWG